MTVYQVQQIVRNYLMGIGFTSIADNDGVRIEVETALKFVGSGSLQIGGLSIQRTGETSSIFSCSNDVIVSWGDNGVGPNLMFDLATGQIASVITTINSLPTPP